MPKDYTGPAALLLAQLRADLAEAWSMYHAERLARLEAERDRDLAHKRIDELESDLWLKVSLPVREVA